jgi:hypothetical protein
MTIFIVETIYSKIYFQRVSSSKKIDHVLISTDHNEDLYVVDALAKFQLNRTTNNHSSELLIEDRRNTLKSGASF